MTAEQIEPRYWSGGCQCGAVRYKVEGPLDEVSVCYCRMCQKATGGAFGLFVKVAFDKITWTRGERKTFASSNHGKRGFCENCGTPLTWEFEHWMDVTVASFDEAAKIEPVVQMALSAQFPWLWRLDAIDVRSDNADPEYANYLASVVSYQHPDHDTDSWTPKGAKG
jgi:hypothetical protein